MSKKEIVIAVSVSLVAGFGSGYILGKRLTVKKVEDWANEEISKAKAEASNPLRKEGVFATPEGAFEALNLERHDGDQIDEVVRQAGRDEVSRMLMKNGYAPVNGIDPASEEDEVEARVSIQTAEDDPNPITGETIVQSIWNNSAAISESNLEVGNEDSEDTMPDRNPDKPYMITVSQFMSDMQYEDNKMSLLYFEEDGTLVDDREQIVPNVEETVGEGNLHQFGRGSGDANALYIRNEKLQCDIEVIRDKRSYSEVVLGIKPERESSAPRKMRDNDE